MKKPTILIILDGLGYSAETKYNAVHLAKTPNLDSWLKNYPHAYLKASGRAVGLLDGDIGNSEVGHLTIGSGRIIKQPLTIIQESIQGGEFFNNSCLKSFLEKIAKSDGRLHIMGLLSDAGVHSHIDHLIAFLKAAKKFGVKNVFIHPFLDGRDAPPKSAKKYLEKLEKEIKNIGVGVIASIHGRFYAMDRDKNWERTKESYEALTKKQETSTSDWKEILEKNYKDGVTDEFILPTRINKNGIIKDGDSVIFFNFRPDRARQITTAFIDPEFDKFKTEKISIENFMTPVSYWPKTKTKVLFEPEPIENTLTEILAKHGKTIFTIAETEKYAHVTYFFNGGREKKIKTETRMLIPSIPAKDYVKIPEMSAKKITQAVLESLKKNPCDFYVINYANADMVGHSGNIQATIKAIECLDAQVKKIYDQVIKMDGTLYITADHGNAEKMFDEKTGQPHTAHTTNKVPFIMIQKNLEDSRKKLPIEKLSDIASFILRNMGIVD